MRHKNNSINYIELPMTKRIETKAFYSKVFGWEFTDWGANYISFAGANIDGGFNGEANVQVLGPGVLIVLYTKNLERKLNT